MFCSSCKCLFQSSVAQLSHYKFHQNELNFEFKCPNSDCCKRFLNYQTVKSHFYRDHENTLPHKKRKIGSCVGLRTHCSLQFCSQALPDFPSHKAHLINHLENGFQVCCPFEGCSNKFASKSAFRSHLSRYHPSKDNELEQSLDQQQTCGSIDDSDLACVEDSTSACGFETSEVTNTPGVSNSDDHSITNRLFLQNLALLYLNLYAKFLVPDSTIQYIIDNVGDILDMTESMRNNELKNNLKSKGFFEDEISDILNNIKTNSELNCANETAKSLFRSAYKRNDFYEKHFNFVKPQEIYLGKDGDHEDSFLHYVPIIATLKEMLKDESVWDQYCNPQCNESAEIYTDFVDGSCFKQNIFFQDKSRIKLLLFQDAFEIVNCLGSARTKHKILATYMTLGNLHDYNRSKVDQIQLVLLCKEKHFKYFGSEKVFQKLLEDINELETVGIYISPNRTILGGVAAILGDNLGSHAIGGFEQNFSTSEYLCRYCLLQRHVFKDNILWQAEDRSRKSYEQCIEYLKVNDVRSYMGVQFDSPFNTLQSFHVCGPGLPPCLAHDLFEGIVSYDVHIILMHFVKRKKWFSIDLLNKRITDFKYRGRDSLDKPAKVKGTPTEKLSGHAIQNWNFLRLLPLIIADKIQDINDQVWQLLLTLREVVDLICSHRISLDQIQYLEDLIKIYLQSRQDLFTEKCLKPKHHFLMHYPKLITQFGPLIKLWTLRYESKHKYFTRVSAAAKNFKNPTLTLSSRHQLLQASYSRGHLFQPPVVPKNPITFNNELYNDDIVEAVNSCTELHGCNDLEICYETLLHGTTYTKTNYLVIHCCGKSLEVGEIMCILLRNVSHSEPPREKCLVYFVLRAKKCNYDSSLGCYRLQTLDDNGIQLKGKWRIVRSDNLSDFYPLPLYHYNGYPYLVLKHAMPGWN